MRRVAVAFVFFLAIEVAAQIVTASDPTATQLAQKAVKALNAAAVHRGLCLYWLSMVIA